MTLAGTREINWWKWLMAAWLLVIVAGHIDLSERLAESRWYRDMIGTTPFKVVKIDVIEADARNMQVKGLIEITRDCVTVGRASATVEKDGRLRYAHFESLEPPSVPSDRPQDTRPQAFGPWQVTSPVDWPDSAQMYRTHRCADRTQTNTVFDLKWPDKPKE